MQPATTGNSLQKVSGTSSWYDAGAVSTQAIPSGDGYVEFTPGNTVTNRMIGLGNGNTSDHYSDIEFAFYVSSNGLQIYEAGVYRGNFGAYASNDLLRVAVESGVVKYRKNGALVYTSTVSPTYPLLVDSSLNTVNSQLLNVVISGAPGGGQSQGFVASQTLGALRSDSPGWTGFKMTIGSQPITVTSLGRFCVAVGNSGTHEVRVIRVSDNTVVASANVSMSGCTVGQFKYAALGTAVTLSASTAYLVVSYEVGSDTFHNWVNTVLTTTAVATVNHGIYTTDGGQTWGPAGSTGNSYVPVSLMYTSGSVAIIKWLVADHLGTPRMVFDKSGSLANTRRHDYLAFGEEWFAGMGGRTTGEGYVADGVRQKFTLKERDIETGLDFFGARYYASTQGRFTSTDPIIMAPERALDPQQINLYAYTRNNPLRFVDPDGETINEPTGLSERDQKRYDDWKKKFLSTAEGQKLWNKYNDDKNFTLNLNVTDRGSDNKNKGAETGDYKFDDKGNMTGATITLGNNIGGGIAGPASDYPVSSTLEGSGAHTIAAAKIGHEFGHVEYNRSLGHLFYGQQQVIDQYNERQNALTRLNATAAQRGNDAALQRISQQFQTQFGATMETVRNQRELGAERTAIPVIRQLLNNKPSSQTQRAMRRLERSP